jgi:hypothetical protein
MKPLADAAAAQSGGSNPAPPELSVIIVNWKSADYTRKCVQSIYKFTSGPRFEIIVVDGASFDGCGEMLAREFPGVIFIQSRENVGFARANNLGVKSAGADSLLFLNPDTELIGPALHILRGQLQSLPAAGAVGAKLLNSDRTLQTSCVQSIPTIINQALDSDLLRRLFPRAKCWGTAALAENSAVPAEVEMLSGACILAKRSVFEEVGGFSEDYFMYCEDADLCHKIRQAGHKIYYVPDASLVHHGGASSSQSRSQFSNVMMKESVRLFFLKTKGRAHGRVYRAAMMLSALCRLLLVAVAAPFQWLRGQGARTGSSARKWAAILAWSLGAQTWVKKPGKL